jgi:hypothetical protein
LLAISHTSSCQLRSRSRLIVNVPPTSTNLCSDAYLVPALPPSSGSGSQTKAWLSGDDICQQLPEVSYTSAGFTVPAIGSTVTVQFYAPYPAWPSVGSGSAYLSEVRRGATWEFRPTIPRLANLLLNRGNAPASAVVSKDCLIKLDASETATQLRLGLSQLRQITATSLRANATFATPPSTRTLRAKNVPGAVQISGIRSTFSTRRRSPAIDCRRHEHLIL